MGVFAATPFGVGTPYWYAQSERANNEGSGGGESAYRIEKIHGLVFVDGKEAPLTRRCGLRK